MFVWYFIVLLALEPQLALSPKSSASETPIQNIMRLIDEGKLDSARGQLRSEVQHRGENYETLFLQARILFGENRYEESLKDLQKSFALNRQDPRVFLLAGMNWVILERLDLARPFFEEASHLAPSDAMMHYHLGRYYYSAQRFAQAEQAFRKTLKLDPESVKAYDNLALALEAQRKTEEAEASYRKAIELAEAQKLVTEWPWLNLAKLLVEKNRPEESLALLQPAERMNPRSPEVFYVRGKVLQKLGRETDAEAALQQSIRFDPKFPDSHYLLGRIFLKQGRKQDAQHEMAIFQGLKDASRKKGGTMVSGTQP